MTAQELVDILKDTEDARLGDRMALVRMRKKSTRPVERLAAEGKDARARGANLRNEVADKQDRVNRVLGEELAKLREELASANKEFRGTKTELDDTKKEVADAKKELTGIRRELEKALDKFR